MSAGGHPHADPGELAPYLQAIRDILAKLSLYPNWNTICLELVSEISTYPQPWSSMSLREGLGGYAIHTPASTSLPPAQAEQRASTAPKQHWSTQYSPAGSSPQTPSAYPYPDLSQTSFNSPALQPRPVFDSGSQRTPSKMRPAAARHVYGTHDSRLDPRSPSQPLSRGPSSVYQNANPEHTPPICNNPESQFSSTPPPRNVPNGNVGDITKFAGPSEHQKIDPSLLPAPQGSPPASKAIKVNLSQLEASIAVEVSPRKPEAQIHPGGSMGGNADPDKREKGLNQAKKIARTNRRKANKIVRPQVPDPRQSIATQIVDPVHGEGHRPKKSKGNPRAPEDGKGYWCPDPDCPARNRRQERRQVRKYISKRIFQWYLRLIRKYFNDHIFPNFANSAIQVLTTGSIAGDIFEAISKTEW